MTSRILLVEDEPNVLIIVSDDVPADRQLRVNDFDQESAQPHVRGFVIKELSAVASNWRSTGDLDDYLKRAGIVRRISDFS